MYARKVSFTGITLAIVTGFLATPSFAKDKIEDLILAELRQIRAQLLDLQSTQAELERAFRDLALRQEDGENLRRAVVDTKTTLSQIEEDLSVLSARLDETNGRIGNLREDLAAMRQVQVPLLSSPSPPTASAGSAPSGPGGTPSSSGVPGSEVAVAAAAPSAVDLYNQAYADYTQGRYSLAIAGFKDVYKLYPTSELADNAQYWIGECYLAQRQHAEALEAFDTVIREYPGSNKLPDAYYKKAMTLTAMGRKAEAMTMLELVIERFPRTQVERLAKQRLAELMRTQPPNP